MQAPFPVRRGAYQSPQMRPECRGCAPERGSRTSSVPKRHSGRSTGNEGRTEHGDAIFESVHWERERSNGTGRDSPGICTEPRGNRLMSHGRVRYIHPGPDMAPKSVRWWWVVRFMPRLRVIYSAQRRIHRYPASLLRAPQGLPANSSDFVPERRREGRAPSARVPGQCCLRDRRFPQSERGCRLDE